jgi:diguanylate cyclase (GGDEF)-like protein
MLPRTTSHDHDRTGSRGPISRGGRRGGPWSVRAYLVLILVTAVLLVITAVGSGYVWSARQAQEQAVVGMRAQAQIATAEIADAVDASVSQVERVASQRGVAGVFLQPSDCSLVLSGSEAFPSARLDIVGPAGQIGCSSDPAQVDLADPVHAGAEWFAGALASTRTAVLWPATDPVTGDAAVVVTTPIPGVGGTPAGGVVALFLDAGRVAASLAATPALADDASLTVIDTSVGTVVSASDLGASPEGTPFAGTGTSGRWADPAGVVRVFGSDDVDLTTDGAGTVPWRVYAGQEHASVVSAARDTLVRQAIAGTVALLVLVAALWLLNGRVAGPLAALTRGAVRARSDAGHGRVPESGTAETVALSRAFNTMLDIRAGQEARLAYQATHDRLTGLPNKEAFRARLDRMLVADPARHPVAVLSVGLSRFGAIVDGIGPDGAERVLVEVAGRLRSNVGPDDVLARSDAYEFLVACPDGSVDGAIALAERLQLAVEEPMGWPAAGVVVRLATGIATERDTADAEQLLREATTAMSQALSRARSWVVFDDSMRVRATHQLETEHGLRDAIALGQLEVHYQPVVDVLEGRLTGAEALVRWRHPERGLVPPMQFIPIAEQTGQIGAIGAFVLAQACAQAVTWAPTGRPFTMSVNVAAEQLLDPAFADEVGRVLATTGLAPDRLCLEVTESAVIRRAGSGGDNLNRLRDMGVRIAVDDFGTGYSSLSYLKHLPITALKIDRSFITRLEHDARDRHLVQAVLGMAKALGLSVVAEGVETAEQHTTLTGLGCDFAQGFLFGRPCAPDEFADLAVRLRDGYQVASAS